MDSHRDISVTINARIPDRLQRFLDTERNIVTERHGDIIITRQRYPGERRNSSYRYGNAFDRLTLSIANLTAVCAAFAIPNHYFNTHRDSLLDKDTN